MELWIFVYNFVKAKKILFEKEFHTHHRINLLIVIGANVYSIQLGKIQLGSTKNALQS